MASKSVLTSFQILSNEKKRAGITLSLSKEPQRIISTGSEKLQSLALELHRVILVTPIIGALFLKKVLFMGCVHMRFLKNKIK